MDIPLELSFHNIEPSDALKAAVQSHVDKLEKFHDHIIGCRVSIDSDAHTPGQLFWLGNGCERAFLCGVTSDRIVNAQAAGDLLDWTASHGG